MTLNFRLPIFAVLQLAWVVFASSSWAQLVINNGLAPPNPANVVTGSLSPVLDLEVRNVGNEIGGAATTVKIVGGTFDDARARDSSTLILDGGGGRYVSAYDFSHIRVDNNSEGFSFSVNAYDDATLVEDGAGIADDFNVGGRAVGTMFRTEPNRAFAFGSGLLVMRGGGVWRGGHGYGYSAVQTYDSSRARIHAGRIPDITTWHSSIATIFGTDFAVDGTPVAFGEIVQDTGILTGTLASGERLAAEFFHAGVETANGIASGRIELVQRRVFLDLYADEAAWIENVGAAAVSSFDTTPENVGLADELDSAPSADEAMGAQLTFRPSAGAMCGNLVIRAAEPGAELVYGDTEQGSTVFPPRSISIGDVGEFDEDDFSLTFLAGSVYGIGFSGNARQFVVYGAHGRLGSDTSRYRQGIPGDFTGIVATEPIVHVQFSGSTSAAIRDLRLVCTASDADGDNMGGLAEHIAGSDPSAADTDNDGLRDGFELDGGTFAPQTVVTDGADGSRSVFAIDLDGDGDSDLLSASYTDGRIAWYENTDRNGNFSGPTEVTTLATTVQSLFAADIDGDGDADILSASSSSDKIAWYENRDGAGGQWVEKLISTLADEARSVTAADIDGDGDLDVLSASSGDDKIAWYENQFGTGVFGAQRVISSVADGAYSVAVGDLDGDGDMDVLSASRKDDKIAWYKNLDGVGTFGAQQVISTLAGGARSVVAADVDGDGDLDVLSASADDDTIAWYDNLDGMGTFGPQVVISTLADGALSVFAADVDGDGDTDVLSASFGDDKIAWYENIDGAGSFGGQNVISTLADGARSVYATDVDGDGDADVLSASANDDKIAWYEQVNVGDPLDSDTDDDGVPDGLEDSDADGLSNLGEQTAGTSALNPDSDGDGSSDGVEVAAATDPLDPLDFPPLSVPGLAPWAIGSLTTILIGLGVSRTRRRAAGGAL